MRFHLDICIRRKHKAAEKMLWFLATGSGGAAARPRKVIRNFMNKIRRCQRAAKDWLLCRASSIEVICRLWIRIEAEIRRDLSDELDRAKRIWMNDALRTGQDNHLHEQWRKLKAKTRSLLARIDWLEKQMLKQEKREKV
ncbi:unnamed protein product, partial [Ascophyllum nodosum]